MRLLVAIIALFTCWPVVLAQNTTITVDRLVIYKHDRKLALLLQGKEVKTYKVALGGEPVGPKTRQGDHRTPEGLYILDSRDANSHYYKAFHVSYPNQRDIAA
jgi:murein L,D-transpeptidase YafK